MNKINKKIYFKKGYFYYLFIPAFIMLLCALEIFIIIRSGKIDYLIFIQQILMISCLVVSVVMFILAYQTIKLPFIIFKADEITQFIGVFRKKNKVNINDIVSFEKDLYSLAWAIKINLKNNKIKRLYLSGISKTDLEYIANFLQERIAGDKNSKSIDSENDNRRNNE